MYWVPTALLLCKYKFCFFFWYTRARGGCSWVDCYQGGQVTVMHVIYLLYLHYSPKLFHYCATILLLYCTEYSYILTFLFKRVYCSSIFGGIGVLSLIFTYVHTPAIDRPVNPTPKHLLLSRSRGTEVRVALFGPLCLVDWGAVHVSRGCGFLGYQKSLVGVGRGWGVKGFKGLRVLGVWTKRGEE